MHTPRVRGTTLLLAAAGWLAAQPASGDVTPHRLFSDHAVLQRDVMLPVWGTTSDGEKVTVEFAGQKVETVARDGRFRVDLAPLAASAAGRTLTFTGRNTVTVRDVLVGEVWLCSGQSNMEASMGWLHKFSPDRAAALAAVADPLVRIAGVPLRHVDEPAADVDMHWQPCDAESMVDFSAVATFFGRDLRKHLGVPVGLIGAYAGGTPAEAWTDRETLRGDAAFARLLDDAASDDSARPACLYNGMIAPLAPFAIRGVIWYQGESNSDAPLLYRRLFPALIGSWRNLWGQGNFPFLFVQIAPCRRWSPGLREAQLLAWQATPNTAMVVTTDVGDADDSHPRQKEPVGTRLALAARALAYGETIEYSGPTFDSMAVEGHRAVLRFTHVGSGLVAAGGDLRGFFIAGADGVYHPAKAEIEGNTVAAWSDAVPEPAAVRYGWASVPDVNLFNREGLPASPFRTDVSDSFVFRTDFPESGAVDLLAGGATSGSADGKTDQFRESWQAETGSPGQREFIVTVTRQALPGLPDGRTRLQRVVDPSAIRLYTPQASCGSTHASGGHVLMSIVDRPIVAPSAPAAPSPAAAPRQSPLTLAMYDRMIAAGVFDPAEPHPLELIGGALHMMSPIGDRHADAVDWLVRWSMQAIDQTQLLVRVQNPLAIPGSESAPQPDIAWVTLRRYADRRPLPEEVSLLIEVADTSLEFDTTVKAGLYAAAGIADYWVVDLVSRAVIVFREPRSGGYESRSTHRGEQAVPPLVRPQAALSPAELFLPG